MNIIALTDGTYTLAGDHSNTDVVLGHPYGEGPNGAPVLNLNGGILGELDIECDPTEVINVKGHVTVTNLVLEAAGGGVQPTINIAANSCLTESLTSGSRAVLHINGAAGARLDHEGFGTVSAAVISATVVGTGTFWTQGNLEFGGFVCANQQVDLNASAQLTIDDPLNFHAVVLLATGWGPGYPGGAITLKGTQGDNWSYNATNDVLAIKQGGVVTDRLRIADSRGEAFAVSRSADGITITGNYGMGDAQALHGAIV